MVTTAASPQRVLILADQPLIVDLISLTLNHGAFVTRDFSSLDEARAAVGWPLTVLPALETCAAPTAPELEALRALETRTAAAHREPVRLPL